MKVLIIDNEMTRQRNLRSILSSLGFKSADVESSDDPSTGLQNMKKKSFNIVFLYRELPKMSALDVLKEIRGNQRLKGIPVVVYSSEVNKEIILEAVQGGASGFVGYPFSVSDVESAMKQATAAANAAKKN